MSEEIKKYKELLLQSEKLASIGQLSAGIMHEIKNPLNFVTNFSKLSLDILKDLNEISEEIKDAEKEDLEELIEELTEISDTIKSNLEKILEHGERAQRIVFGMLAQSGNQKPVLQETDINQLLEEYTKLAYHGVRGHDKDFNVTLKFELDKAIEKIKIYPSDFSRVILNLVNNACYAVDEVRKKINEDYDPIITVSSLRKNDDIIIKIKDNGTGISEEIKDKIFQSFFSTKPMGEGTGLGLSLSYDIITKNHKGKLSLESKQGEYTEFIIKIPTNLK